MNWVLKFLRRRLNQEQTIAEFHGSMAADRRYAESARMARQRIPQLQDAIHILESHAGESLPWSVTRKATPTNKQLQLF